MKSLRLKDPVYIVDAKRLPIGSPFKSLKHLNLAEMSALVLTQIAKINQMPAEAVDEVVMGSAVLAGAGQNYARRAAYLSGFHQAHSYVVSNACGAGMQAVIEGAKSILVHDAEIVFAGGAESVTQAPYLLKKEDVGVLKNQQHYDSSIYDGLFCQMTHSRMGDLAEDLAKKYKITRQQQDRFAYNSCEKAYQAHQKGFWDGEIVAVKNASGRKISKDDRIRKNLNYESFQSLPASFDKKGTVTSGNASSPSDGAAGVLLASERAVIKYDLKPMARLIAWSSCVVKPELTFEANVRCVPECLKAANWSMKSVDLFEISESFAAQAIYTQKNLGIPDERFNILGGDLALGHPLGMAGIRVIVTLLNALFQAKGKKGVASICFGGGGVISMCVEVV